MENWGVSADWEDGGHGRKLPSLTCHPSDSTAALRSSSVTVSPPRQSAWAWANLSMVALTRMLAWRRMSLFNHPCLAPSS